PSGERELACASPIARTYSLSGLPLLQPQLPPPLHHRIDILLLRPHRRREARAAEIGVRVVVEIDGGVDQHAVPFAGAELRDVAVALAHRGIEAGAEGRGHDDDVVLAGIDAER